MYGDFMGVWWWIVGLLTTSWAYSCGSKPTFLVLHCASYILGQPQNGGKSTESSKIDWITNKWEVKTRELPQKRGGSDIFGQSEFLNFQRLTIYWAPESWSQHAQHNALTHLSCVREESDRSKETPGGAMEFTYSKSSPPKKTVIYHHIFL